MNVAFLGLGGNIGDRLKNLDETISALKEHCGEIIQASSVYETEAWGSDSEKKYLNQVVKLNTDLSAEHLMHALLKIEADLGRNRSAEQNSDRTADLDILFYNDAVIESKHIHIPHPRLHLRNFVLVPLNEIAGEFVHPLLKKSIADLLKNCADPLEVKRIKDR